MLNVINRLKKTRDLNLLMKHGTWIRGSFLAIKFVKLPDVEDFFPKKEDKTDFAKQLKIIFSVGLKISKLAVRRNGVKRKLREVVRLLIKDSKIKSGYYIMFTATKEILDKNYHEIEKEINIILKKAQILC